MTTFTVDTHLFRELGELLVGRDSTALIELIKNAYDADAREVVLYGEGLSSTARGYISIKDDGIGMSQQEFENGFLRIAARTKETSQRRSLVFERRYTGAKGIGRLAAHKLARSIEIESLRWDGAPLPRHRGDSFRLPAVAEGLRATINWDTVEEKKTLDEVDTTDAIVVGSYGSRAGIAAGTTITLRRLRRRWTTAEHARFLDEVQAFEPPKVLLAKIPASVLKEPLLFEEPTVRDVAESLGAQFSVKLEGELAPSDDYWTAVAAAANWIIEIDANKRTKKVHYAIGPTASTRREVPEAVTRKFEVAHPSPDVGPFFQARVLKRVGVQKGDEDLKDWASRINGVKIFMEGFRVLPYGERRNDWLNLDADVAERGRGNLSKNIGAQLELQLRPAEKDPNIGLIHVGNKHYVGGVFLTERSAPSLRMLVNREGFVPDPGYQTLVDLVRRGIDLCTRVQAAATQKTRNERSKLRAENRGQTPLDHSLMPVAASIASAVRDAQTHATEAKRLAAGGKIDAATREIQSAASQVEKLGRVSNEYTEEAAMVRVLASVGTQLASFVHEINGLLGIANAVDIALTKIRDSVGLSPIHKRELGLLHRSVSDLKRALERQASYLVDVVTPDARRRRSRQSFSKLFDASVKLIEFAAERRNIAIVNKLPGDLRSPPMFRAELTTVFSNLLTNAVKAAGNKGRIQITGKETRDGVVLRVENTGVRVRVREGETWFKPFESSTTDVDPVLGQGMGLGLPITRSMLEEYGATVRFVEPGNGFATALEIGFSE